MKSNEPPPQEIQSNQIGSIKGDTQFTIMENNNVNPTHITVSPSLENQELNEINIFDKSSDNSSGTQDTPHHNSDFPFFKNFKRSQSILASPIPPSDIFWARFTFIVFGVSGFFNWTVVMNAAFAIFSVAFKFPRGADTLLFGYFALSFVVSLTRYILRTLHPNLVHAGVILLYITNIILPLIIYFFPNMIGVILMHIIGALVGVGVTLIVSNGMAYAAIIPINMTGFVMAGQGVAGLLGFITWQIISVIFDITDLKGVQYASACTFGTCWIMALIFHLFYVQLLRKPWFQNSVSEFSKTNRVELDPIVAKQATANNYNSLTYSKNNLVGVRPVRYILSDAKTSMLLGIFTITITFILFPNIGPYDWIGPQVSNMSILIGVFQVVDFLGRLLPNLRGIFIVPYRYLLIVVPLRLIFFPIFIAFTQIEHPFVNSMITQIFLMVVFAATNGFVASQAISDVPRRVLTTGERGVAGLLLNIAMQCAFAVAIILSQVIKAIYGIFE